jgi:hypothetical protein
MKSKHKVLSVPVFSLRRIETPYERGLGYRSYLAVVEARDLPDLKDWREINVRDARLRGRVPRAIREGFTGHADEFFFMNRGLVLAAAKVDYSQDEKRMAIHMSDPEIHGLLDGGHTYRVVKDAAMALSPNDPPRYVRVEIVTGFDRDTISDVVDARNTSNQVKDESLANLRQEFDPLKEVLQSQPYFSSIAWSEYEEFDNGQAKAIDIRDIISYLITFDASTYNSTAQPLIAYKDKRACLKHFQEKTVSMRKLYPLLPEILKLWDAIHEHWPEWYSEGRHEEAGIHGRFGKLTGITMLPESLEFARKSVDYRMPSAYKYPILSALRAGIRMNGKAASWTTDPFEILSEAGVQLASIVGAAIRSTNNPNKVGKDVGVWSSCFLVVESALRGTQTQQAEKRIQELQAELEALKSKRGMK